MPRPWVQPRTPGVTGLLIDQHDRFAEQRDVDVGSACPQRSIAHLQHRGAGDQHRDDRHTHDQAYDEGDGGVERREHESRHRGRHGGTHEQPERRAEPLAVLGAEPDTARCLLHYPRWVTETVDVLIMASDVPTYAHPGDAGADLVAAEAVRLEPGRRALVGTGVRIALPEGFAAFVVPRSGLAAKHGITVVNAPGTVDAGYRGEIKVTLLNTDAEHAYE